MIDWKILNYLNKQKYKNTLLIVKNIQEVEKFIKSTTITVIEEKNLIEYLPENPYHIIATWDSLSKGAAVTIYSYLAKMNYSLRDDGIIYLRVLKNKAHTEDDFNDFCWNSERINSIGKAKALKRLGKEEIIQVKNKSYIRFKYIPAV